MKETATTTLCTNKTDAISADNKELSFYDCHHPRIGKKKLSSLDSTGPANKIARIIKGDSKTERSCNCSVALPFVYSQFLSLNLLRNNFSGSSFCFIWQ